MPVYSNYLMNNYWTCEEWMQFHQALEKEYGSLMGMEVWLKFWNAPENSTLPAWDCGFNTEFVTYFAERGVEIGNWPISTWVWTKMTVSEYYATAMKWAPWVLGGAAVAIAAYYGVTSYNEYRTYKTVRKAAQNLAKR